MSYKEDLKEDRKFAIITTIKAIIMSIIILLFIIFSLSFWKWLIPFKIVTIIVWMISWLFFTYKCMIWFVKYNKIEP